MLTVTPHRVHWGPPLVGLALAVAAVAALGLVVVVSSSDTTSVSTRGQDGGTAGLADVVADHTGTCRHPAEGYQVTLPAGWWVAPVDEAPCRFFHPVPLTPPSGATEWYEPAVVIWSTELDADLPTFAATFGLADQWQPGPAGSLTVETVSDGLDGFDEGSRSRIWIREVGDRVVVVSVSQTPDAAWDDLIRDTARLVEDIAPV